jgi:hypothetical protein
MTVHRIRRFGSSAVTPAGSRMVPDGISERLGAEVARYRRQSDQHAGRLLRLDKNPDEGAIRRDVELSDLDPDDRDSRGVRLQVLTRGWITSV